MTAKPKFYKRIRRKVAGGLATFRIYDDGTVKVRVDHPSNDPGIEIALTGMIVHDLTVAGRALGIIEFRPKGPLIWKDDPA